ncbi:MAG TPA: META domain-containing protein [Acidimicrobiales bacterium]|nr:META domain-containing protein [Acidimicrobiales bacterium]
MSTTASRPTRLRGGVLALMCLGVVAYLGASCTWNPDIDTRSATQGLPNTKVDLIADAWRLDVPASNPKLAATASAASASPEGGPSASGVTIDFHADGTVSGRAPCNSFDGSFTVDGDSVTIAKIAATMMACEEPVMDDESTLLEALEAEHHVKFSADHDTLTLTGTSPGNAETRLVFGSYDPYE